MVFAVSTNSNPTSSLSKLLPCHLHPFLSMRSHSPLLSSSYFLQSINMCSAVYSASQVLQSAFFTRLNLFNFNLGTLTDECHYCDDKSHQSLFSCATSQSDRSVTLTVEWDQYCGDTPLFNSTMTTNKWPHYDIWKKNKYNQWLNILGIRAS